MRLMHSINVPEHLWLPLTELEPSWISRAEQRASAEITKTLQQFSLSVPAVPHEEFAETKKKVPPLRNHEALL